MTIWKTFFLILEILDKLLLQLKVQLVSLVFDTCEPACENPGRFTYVFTVFLHLYFVNKIINFSFISDNLSTVSRNAY